MRWGKPTGEAAAAPTSPTFTPSLQTEVTWTIAISIHSSTYHRDDNTQREGKTPPTSALGKTHSEVL
ncbi:hypothetical protein XENOCAPTIV_012768, partial [Xenoophorus captivus]